MKDLLDKMHERMKYLESEQAKEYGMDEVEIKWRVRELTLAIIHTQEELLKQMNDKCDHNFIQSTEYHDKMYCSKCGIHIIC